MIAKPNQPDLETTLASLNRRMNKQSVVYLYNGILLSNENRWLIHALSKINLKKKIAEQKGLEKSAVKCFL